MLRFKCPAHVGFDSNRLKTKAVTMLVLFCFSTKFYLLMSVPSQPSTFDLFFFL